MKFLIRGGKPKLRVNKVHILNWEPATKMLISTNAVLALIPFILFHLRYFKTPKSNLFSNNVFNGD